MKGPAFRTLYCQRMGIGEDQFPQHLLVRALYPHARPLAGLLARFGRQHFQADYEFIEDVGHLVGLNGFSDAAQNYVDHFSNRGFTRRVLRLRVSVRRMLDLVRPVLPAEPGSGLDRLWRKRDSLTPFRGNPGTASPFPEEGKTGENTK